MIKVSRLADYAVVVLASLSDMKGEIVTASGLSGKTNLPEPTVAKVLKLLAKDGLIQSVRGASGGYTMNKTPQEISIADIIVAVDGPISLATCVEGNSGTCDFAGHCSVKGRWDGVNDAIRDALENVALSDMFQQPSKIKPVSLASASMEDVIS